MTKICAYCEKEFEPSKDDARIIFCSEKCRTDSRRVNGYMKKYYNGNPEKWSERQQSEKYKEAKNLARRTKYANDEKYRDKHKSNVKQYQESNPEIRFAQRLRRYGINPIEYRQMLKKQDGKCAICGRPDSGDNQANRFYVDHDHKTGKVRGLLCSQCNMGLGKFFDNTEYLKNAITYLEENK